MRADAVRYVSVSVFTAHQYHFYQLICTSASLTASPGSTPAHGVHHAIATILAVVSTQPVRLDVISGRELSGREARLDPRQRGDERVADDLKTRALTASSVSPAVCQGG